MRTMLHADQITAISRPPVLEEGEVTSGTVPTVEEMAKLLVPYHVNQDMDNSVEAIAKGRQSPA